MDLRVDIWSLIVWALDWGPFAYLLNPKDRYFRTF